MKFLDNHKEAWEQFIITGNLDCLSKIYFNCYDYLFDYGMRMTSDRQSVEDAIQSEFMNLIKSRKNIGEVQNLPGYLISTFRRQLLTELKKQKQMIPSEELPEEQFDYFKTPDQEITDVNSREKIYQLIEDCISRLTPKQKEMIYLRFEKEIPYETIAEMLNISVDSCYKSVYRSINSIRLILQKDLNGVEILLFLMFRSNNLRS